MFEIRECDETGSTNDDAAALLGEPGSAGVVIVADRQRAGRGRHERAWIAPPGSSLLFTAILPATVASSALWSVPFWVALGVAEGIERTTGLHVALQWPNDLLLGDRKCCGILCISRVAGERAHVGCGVGLNVQRPAADDGELAAIDPPPVFLSDRAPAPDRRVLLAAILATFSERELESARDVARAWERRAQLAGTTYRLLLDGSDTPFVATAERIADDGSLVVTRDGVERRIALADARVLR